MLGNTLDGGGGTRLRQEQSRHLIIMSNGRSESTKMGKLVHTVTAHTFTRVVLDRVLLVPLSHPVSRTLRYSQQPIELVIGS